MPRIALLLFWSLVNAAPGAGQPLHDSSFVWKSYAREGVADVRIFSNPASEDRPHTIILRELARNTGPTTVADGRYIVELIGRHYDITPETATWIFHWGSFSFPDARGGKQLFLRATFRRNHTGTLSTPSWRVISREEVEELTGRRYP